MAINEAWQFNLWKPTMPRKKDKQESEDVARDKLTEIFDLLTSKEREDRAAYRVAFTAVRDALQGKPPIIRAEGLLQFWSDRLSEWGDHEAVVYLISRGEDPIPFARTILANWRAAENALVNREMGGGSNLRGRDPCDYFSRFWGLFDSQECTIDATMLRTVEWCNIRGFDRWWENLGKNIKESAFSGGANNLEIFSYCRSDLAVRTMSECARFGPKCV
jgi:hypothetical protein